MKTSTVILLLVSILLIGTASVHLHPNLVNAQASSDALTPNEVSGQIFIVGNPVPATCSNDVVNGNGGLNGVRVYLKNGSGEVASTISANAPIYVNNIAYYRDGIFRIQYPANGTYQLCVDTASTTSQFYCSSDATLTSQCETITVSGSASPGHRFGFKNTVTPTPTCDPNPKCINPKDCDPSTKPRQCPPIPSPTGGASSCALKSKGDANCDGVVDRIDYYYVVRQLAAQPLPTTVSCDFNADKQVDAADRAIIVAALQ